MSGIANIQELLEGNTTLTMDLTTEISDFTVVGTATVPDVPAPIESGTSFTFDSPNNYTAIYGSAIIKVSGAR